jgi:hypothetical protein
MVSARKKHNELRRAVKHVGSRPISSRFLSVQIVEHGVALCASDKRTHKHANTTHTTWQLSARGLFHAAQWAAELLTQIDVDDDDDIDDDDDDDDVAARLQYDDAADDAFGGDYDDDAATPVEDEVLLAKTYFDCKEYRRAAAVLTRLPSFALLAASAAAGGGGGGGAAVNEFGEPAPLPSHRAIFMCYYSLCRYRSYNTH